MFYDVFSSLCRERRIAPSALARKLGMSSSAPGRWKGGSSPDLDTAAKIADYFGVSVDFLIDRQSEAPTHISAADNSVVVQGNSGNSNVALGDVNTGGEALSDMEKELLRVFRGLDMRKKNVLMSRAYDIEDSMSKEV